VLDRGHARAVLVFRSIDDCGEDDQTDKDSDPRGSQREWIIESYDRRTDRDGESRFTTEAAFIRAREDLLRNGGRGFVSATLPDGTIVRDELALRALIAASSMGVEAVAGHTENPSQTTIGKHPEMLEVEARSHPIP
jgi:hypothetical protein